MPQQESEQPIPALPAQIQAGYGGMLMGMAPARNLGHFDLAMTFTALTDGRLYRSGSTFARVGMGYNELTPSLVADFATVLDIPADVLAALTGMELPDPPLPRNPAAPDIAKLIWDVRRLTTEQMRQVRDQAKSMRQQ